ncbi:Zinc finger CCCH domain-containing protein 41, partial [Mucuna pruriens]
MEELEAQDFVVFGVADLVLHVRDEMGIGHHDWAVKAWNDDERFWCKIVAVLKEHFSPYGDLSAVELEDVQVNDSSQQEAHITFTTRWAAERAYINGKCWKDHNLKFMWLTPTSSSNATGSRERSLSSPKEPLDTDDHSEEKLGNSVDQEAIVSDGEHENSETKNGLELVKMEPSEDPQCTTGQVSSPKQSPGGNLLDAHEINFKVRFDILSKVSEEAFTNMIWFTINGYGNYKSLFLAV